MEPTAHSSRRWALLATFLVPLALALALGWPLALDLGGSFHPSAFGPSHAWVGDQLWRALTDDGSLLATRRAGYPWPRQMRIIGWLPLLLALPLRPFLGPLAAFNLVALLALPLSALATWPLVRRWTGAGPWSAAAACVVFAASPFALGTLATGELPKLAIGLIPLFLWTLDRSLDAPRPLGWLLATAGLALATAFTEPYYGLLLPLPALALLVVDAARRRRLGRPLAAGLALGLGMLPARLYFDDVLGGTVRWLFMPAQSGPPPRLLPTPHPVASLADLALGLTAPLHEPWDARHVAYLGTPLALLLLALALAARQARPGRRAALALLLAGAVLSLGPWLFLGTRNTDVPLPALAFWGLRYPLAHGGMFYRLAALGALGLALWLAVETARRPRLAWLLVLLQVGDAVRASGPWPLAVRPVPAAAQLRGMRGTDGAVLDLPVVGGLIAGQRGLLRALVHGRPTTALPRIATVEEIYNTRALWERALGAEDAPRALRALGIRYVIAGGAADAARLGPLGPPAAVRDGISVWDLGPAPLRARRVGELSRKPPRPAAGRGAEPPGDREPR